MKHALFALIAVLLAACSTGTPVKDFENRAIFYTWVDAKDITGNRLTSFQVRNLSVPGSERYYQMGWEEMGGGYLVYHYGVKPGQYEFDKLWMMSCIGPLCSNTINEFSFGQLGSGIGAKKVAKPGDVAFGGCYAFKRTKRGFFRPGEFETRKSACGVSKSQMLQMLMKNATLPINQQRIRGAM